MVSNSEACNYQLAVRSQQGVRVHVNDREDLATSENRFQARYNARPLRRDRCKQGKRGSQKASAALPVLAALTNKSLPHAAQLLRARQRAAHQ